MKKLLLACALSGLSITAFANNYMESDKNTPALNDAIKQCHLHLSGSVTGPSEKNMMNDCMRMKGFDEQGNLIKK